MGIPIELIYHYPWLPSLKNIYSEDSNKDPIEFINDLFKKYPNGEISERIVDIFKTVFDNLESISYYKSDEINIYSYLILKILLYLFRNNFLINKVADRYSKISYNELIDENDANIYDICQDLNLDIKYYQHPIKYGVKLVKDYEEPLETNFIIYYIDYLRLSANIRDEYRKLINNPISKGFVFLRKKDLVRLIQEYVRKKILTYNQKEENSSSLDFFKSKLLKIDQFKEIFDWIQKEWKSREKKIEQVIYVDKYKSKDISNIYPPCIKEIVKKTSEGQNLIHNERLFLTWFLLAINYSVDEIVEIFSAMPDFDREKTYYQVNYASKKKYDQ